MYSVVPPEQYRTPPPPVPDVIESVTAVEGAVVAMVPSAFSNATTGCGANNAPP